MNAFARLLEWLEAIATVALRPSDSDAVALRLTDSERAELLSIVTELLSPRYCDLLDEEEVEFLEAYDWGSLTEFRDAYLVALRDIGIRVRGGPQWGDVVELPDNEKDDEDVYLDIDDEALDGRVED